jgi:hypothetical protein
LRLGVYRDQAGLNQSLDLVAHGARREAGAAASWATVAPGRR